MSESDARKKKKKKMLSNSSDEQLINSLLVLHRQAYANHLKEFHMQSEAQIQLTKTHPVTFETYDETANGILELRSKNKKLVDTGYKMSKSVASLTKKYCDQDWGIREFGKQNIVANFIKEARSIQTSSSKLQLLYVIDNSWKKGKSKYTTGSPFEVSKGHELLAEWLEDAILKNKAESDEFNDDVIEIVLKVLNSYPPFAAPRRSTLKQKIQRIMTKLRNPRFKELAKSLCSLLSK